MAQLGNGLAFVTARKKPAAEWVTPAAVREAIAFSEPGQRLAWLAAQAGVELVVLLPQAAVHFGLEVASAANLRQLVPDFARISFAECQRRQVAVGTVPGSPRTLVMLTDPTDARLASWLDLRLRAAVRSHTLLVTPEDLKALLARAEHQMRAKDSLRFAAPAAGSSAGTAQVDINLSLAQIDAASSPVVRLVDSMLHDALRTNASDIHFETTGSGLTVKYRVDGVLEVVQQLSDAAMADQALSRIKVLAELDIAERRVPQDGRFAVRAHGRDIDFRVSVMPNLFGEDAVLRVLDRAHLAGTLRQLTLQTLGFEPQVLDFLRELADQPYGLLLVTGPTGSGKTTTLYGVLGEINTGLDKIVTIEDPVEYQLPGILQIPVNEKKGLTFARGLRSILRHDPDKIMVGEIRDAETAQIAVQAALTGHQVFTTVHANNVFDVIGRFANMGVDAYNLVSALTGVVAQRLVRRSCTACAEPYEPAPALFTACGVPHDAGAPWRRGIGCKACRGSGYSGRLAIAETLRLTDELRELMVQRAPVSRIRQCAVGQGFVDLRQAAVALAQAGHTTLEEVKRVTPTHGHR
ncbi:MAG: type II/IV secretion system protein [Rubrivivax sp.]|nr:type II/IV secretion system protein [Rubrivivax sp.]